MIESEIQNMIFISRHAVSNIVHLLNNVAYQNENYIFSKTGHFAEKN